MSEDVVKEEEIIEYVNPRVLRPDPNQPRQLDWNSDEVQEELELLAETFEAQNVINPIEIDENNNIILGERRWRAALLKGLEMIPVRRKVGLTQRERFERQLIDDAQRKQLTPQERVWDYATAVVNINTNENYTVSDIKQMHKRDAKQLLGLIAAFSERDEEGRQKRMGQNLLARRIGISQARVSQYLSWFKVGVEMQEAFMDGEIPIEYVWRVATLFDNNKFERTEEQIGLEEKILSGEIESSDQLAVIIDQTRKEIEKRRAEAAREIVSEIVPEVKEPETPEELEEVARVLKREAERRKTPEQIHKEKQEKARNALLTGRSSVTARIEKAKELGIDTKWMEEEKEKIENKMSHYPDDALSDSRALKKQIDEMIDRAQEKQREAEIREKVEKELKKEKVEEIKEELRRDEEFKEELRTELMKEMMPRPSIGAPPPVEIPEEEARVLRERIEEQRQRMREWMLDPEIQKRGKLFKNWVAHGAMLDVMGSVFCPKDGEKLDWKNLRWSCCGLSVEEAYEMLRKKLSRTSTGTTE